VDELAQLGRRLLCLVDPLVHQSRMGQFTEPAAVAGPIATPHRSIARPCCAAVGPPDAVGMGGVNDPARVPA
jgi:hypothetical protein